MALAPYWRADVPEYPINQLPSAEPILGELSEA